jgi:hypothetical protein
MTVANVTVQMPSSTFSMAIASSAIATETNSGRRPRDIASLIDAADLRVARILERRQAAQQRTR